MSAEDKITQYSIVYRPHKWEDVYGQDVVVGALKRRVLSNNYPKATLLVGPFGTGKTTIAEILAACMQASLPDGNPDWNHPSNKPILNETFTRDTQRLDGSRIGGKGDVVEFTSILKVKPMYDRKRILIIEEADQLSSAAQNALLKVLEDPDANTHFILLSMNDKSGVSAPIKSRCQVYSVKSLKTADLMKAMKHVMEVSGDWQSDAIPDEFKLKGLSLIASASKGSLRVALQNLEGCIVAKAYTPEEIGTLLEDVADDIKMFKMLQMILDKSNEGALWDFIFDNKDPMHLYNYMSMLVAEAILWKQTGYKYSETAYGLEVLGKHKNIQSFFDILTSHPLLNKPFIRTTDLVAAIMSFYQEEPRIKIGTDTPPQFLVTTTKPTQEQPVIRMREVRNKVDDAFAKYYKPDEPTF